MIGKNMSFVKLIYFAASFHEFSLSYFENITNYGKTDAFA